MDKAELTALLTPQGLRMIDEVGPLASTAEVAAAVSRLRAAGHSPDLVSAVVGQAHLRVRAEGKFGPFAERMLFTGMAIGYEDPKAPANQLRAARAPLPEFAEFIGI